MRFAVYQRNRRDLNRLIRKLAQQHGAFTYRELVDEFKKGRPNYRIDGGATIRDRLDDLVELGVMGRMGSYYWIRKQYL